MGVSVNRDRRLAGFSEGVGTPGRSGLPKKEDIHTRRGAGSDGTYVAHGSS